MHLDMRHIFCYSVMIPTHMRVHILNSQEASDMQIRPYPVIDPVATGNNIRRLRMERGMSVRDLQAYFGFEQPQAIYKWQHGTSLPSVDNLYALGALLEVPMDEILVSTQANITKIGQQEKSCCPQHISVQFYSGCPGRGRRRETLQPFSPLSCA